jgi:hypothetical protein
MTRTFLPLAALVGVCACYRYVPDTSPQPAVGSEYRAHLTSDGSTQVRPILGQNVVRVDGRLIAVSDSVYEVAMGATTTSVDPRPTIWSGEVIRLPRDAVDRMERRELDRPRTVRAAALYTAGVVLAGSVWLSISGRASESGGNGPGPINP